MNRVFSYDLEVLPDGSLRFLRADAGLLDLWGYSLDEIQERGWAKLILPKDMERIENIIRTLSVGHGWRGRIRTISRDGSVRILSLALEPEVLDDRTLVRALARDATDAALRVVRLDTLEESPADAVVVGPLWIDPQGYVVKKEGREIPLTVSEFKLLLEFARTPDRVLRHQTLAERVWGHDFVSPSNVPMAVKRLRDKIEDDPGEPRLIETVRGIGYRMRSAPTDTAHEPIRSYDVVGDL